MTIQDLYLTLLRKAIGLDHADLTSLDLSNADWNEILRLSQCQGTAALVFNELLPLSPLAISHSPFANIPSPLLLKQTIMQNMLSYERLLSLLKETWQGLEQGGVQPVVLKGFGLATLYPTPYLRAWGDLDIYVGPKQYHQAAEVLRRVFPDAKHHDEEWEDLKHYNFVLPNGLIEMHRTSVKLENPGDNAYFWQLEQEAMRYGEKGETAKWQDGVQWVEIEDVRFAIPEAKFNLLFTFFHAWFHFIEEGLGFKQICDVALLAHHTYSSLDVSSSCESLSPCAFGQLGISTAQAQGDCNQAKATTTKSCDEKRVRQKEFEDYLRKSLKKLKLWEPWQLMGYVCVEALGLPKEEWPLYEVRGKREEGRAKLFLDRIMTEGLIRPKDFGKSKDRYEAREKARQMNILARKWKTLKSRFAGALAVYPYSPQYAWHMMWSSVVKGMRRTMKGEGMINY